MFGKTLVFVFLLSGFLCAPALAQMKNGLPPTQMDSFVRQAAGNAELIYGDESHRDGPPPYFEFTYDHRINNGIYDIRDAGLTTGHGSLMPSAWGRDEFLGAEWSQSGANSGNPQLSGPGTTMDQSGATAQAVGPVAPPPMNPSQQQQNLPAPPAPGYQPMFQHGTFVGWYSPQEVALAKTNFPAALRSVVNGPYYFGGDAGRNSILSEIGDAQTPI